MTKTPTRYDALCAVETLLNYISRGVETSLPPEVRAGTPNRFLTAWETSWGIGYEKLDPSTFKMFETDAPENAHHIDYLSDTYNEMVFVKGINFYSHCEHHMTPFFGTAVIAYLPTQRGLIGLSKLARVVDHFARRLQVQERLTVQIADTLAKHVSPHFGVMLQAHHMCMASRGVCQPNATTQTTALRGDFLDDRDVRTEFLDGCRK